MVISTDEALTILRKWQQEGRPIQASLSISGRISSSALGRIQQIGADGLIKIDGSSMFHTGRLNSIAFELFQVIEVRFEDWRNAPPEHAQQLRDVYDCFLFMNFGHYNCEFYATKTADELAPT